MHDRMKIRHPDTSGSEITWLSSPAAAGQGVLTVQSNEGFNEDEYVIVGQIGEERAEIRKIASKTGNTQITVDNLQFDHASNTPITVTKYNQVKVYSATSEDGGYAQIPGSPFDLDVDRLYTNITDSSVTPDTWYKVSYFNSTTLTESSFSDAMEATGPKKGSARELINDVRRDTKLGDSDEVVSDDDILSIFNDAQDFIQTKKGFTHQEAETTLSSVQGQEYYELPEDVLKIRDLAITNAGQIYYPRYVQRDEFNFNEQISATQSSIPNHYTIWGRRLYIRPLAATNGTDDIRILYYKKLAHLDSDQDVPDIQQTEVLTYYANMIISAIRENYKAVGFWEQRFERALTSLLETGGGTKQMTKFNRVRRRSEGNVSSINWPREIG